LHDSIDRDFLIIARALTRRLIKRSQHPVSDPLIDSLGGLESQPELRGSWKSREMCLATGQIIELNDFSSVARVSKFKPEDVGVNCLGPTGRIALCSEDFLGACVDFERLTKDAPLESAKTG